MAAARKSMSKSKLEVPEYMTEESMEDVYEQLMSGTGAHLVSDVSKGVLHDRVKVPTPIPQLNCIFGGGVPLGVIVEMYGDPASGKTSASYQMLGEFQIMYPPGKGIAIVVDTEASVDSQRMKFLGCDARHIIRIPAGTVEKGFEILYTMLDKKVSNERTKDLPVFILWDTIGISPTEKEMDSTSEYAQGMMGHGKLIKNQLAKMLPRIEQQPVIMILLNQVYTSMDRYGNSKLVSGGGYGLKHNAHLRIEFSGGKDVSRETDDDDKNPLFIIGKSSTISLEKSKISPLFKGIPFFIDVTKGGVIDAVESMLIFSKERRDYIINKGAWWKINPEVWNWFPEYQKKFGKYGEDANRRYDTIRDFFHNNPVAIKLFQLCFLKEISETYQYQAAICKPYYDSLKAELDDADDFIFEKTKEEEEISEDVKNEAEAAYQLMMKNL